jgi:hypothetical protein
MRSPADASKVRRFMDLLGRAARGRGAVYFTGGATAVLLGWRETTIDIDLKLDPEPPGAFEALPRLKDELEVNVELASPDDFLPPLPGWRERSRRIAICGEIQFLHYDFYAQALAKIERGHAQDAADVRSLLASGLVDPAELRRLHAAIEPGLLRYPAVDPESLRRKLDEALRTPLGKQGEPA